MARLESMPVFAGMVVSLYAVMLDPVMGAAIVFGLTILGCSVLVIGAAARKPRPRRRSQAEIWRDDANPNVALPIVLSAGESVKHSPGARWDDLGRRWMSPAEGERRRIEAAIADAKTDFVAGRTDRATFETELDLFLADLDKLESVE